MTRETPIDAVFWLKWVVVNAIAWLIAFVFPDLAMPGVRIMLFGAIVGLAQAVLLGGLVDEFGWLMSNAVGWFVGFLTAEIAWFLLNGTWVQGNFFLWGFVLGSLFSAGLQYWVHWRRIGGLGVFLLFTGTGALAGYVSGLVLTELSLLNSLWSLGTLAQIALSGALLGAVSGLPLLRWLPAAAVEVN